MSDQRPTEDDLIKLSRRGIVCYAVRCAMRVVHLTKPYPDLHEKSLACIEVATQYCLAPGIAAAAAAAAANAAAYAAYADAYADAYAAAYAAKAAAYADANANATDRTAAVRAAAAAAYAAYVQADIPHPRFWDDYNKLLRLTGRQAGALGAPIDPREKGDLGPLWPVKVKDDNQELLKAIEESDPETLLTVYFDESSGLTPEHELLFLKYLNALYQEEGGVGLKIISDKQFEYKEALINVY